MQVQETASFSFEVKQPSKLQIPDKKRALSPSDLENSIHNVSAMIPRQNVNMDIQCQLGSNYFEKLDERVCQRCGLNDKLSIKCTFHPYKTKMSGGAGNLLYSHCWHQCRSVCESQKFSSKGCQVFDEHFYNSHLPWDKSGMSESKPAPPVVCNDSVTSQRNEAEVMTEVSLMFNPFKSYDSKYQSLKSEQSMAERTKVPVQFELTEEEKHFAHSKDQQIKEQKEKRELKSSRRSSTSKNRSSLSPYHRSKNESTVNYSQHKASASKYPTTSRESNGVIARVKAQLANDRPLTASQLCASDMKSESQTCRAPPIGGGGTSLRHRAEPVSERTYTQPKHQSARVYREETKQTSPKPDTNVLDEYLANDPMKSMYSTLNSVQTEKVVTNPNILVQKAQHVKVPSALDALEKSQSEWIKIEDFLSNSKQ